MSTNKQYVYKQSRNQTLPSKEISNGEREQIRMS